MKLTPVYGGGDINNDGVPDIIVGANYTASNTGRVYVYSGQTWGLLYTFNGEATGDDFGYGVASAGDVNNDGYDDIIIGAYSNDEGGAEAGKVYVFSGQTGDTLHIFTGQPDDRLGYSVSGAGDLNNDGYDDFIISATSSDQSGVNSGRVEVYSGQTGELLYSMCGEADGDYFGVSVSGGGDINNDGVNDFVIGAYGYDYVGSNFGRAYVYLTDGSCIPQAPTVISTTPYQNEINVPLNSPVSVQFDIEVDSLSIISSSFVVSGSFSGLKTGVYSYDAVTFTSTFTPDTGFFPNELVTVSLTNDIRSSPCDRLEGSHVWTFTTATAPSSAHFVQDTIFHVDGHYLSDLTFTDLDSDHDIDIFATMNISLTAQVFRNDGSGSFELCDVASAGSSGGFAVDLDHDSNLDFITSHFGDRYLSILYGDGGCQYGEDTVYFSEGSMDVHAMDLNSDGFSDIMAANYAHEESITVRLNQTGRVFGDTVKYQANTAPSSVWSADLDNDWDMDIIATSYNNDSLTILRNNGDGTFGTLESLPMPSTPNIVIAADLDGDSFIDLIVSHILGITILTNDGIGGFNTSQYNYANHPRPSISDMDGDGDIDIQLVWNEGCCSQLILMENDGLGVFAETDRIDVGEFIWNPYVIQSVDFDGDGDADIAIGHYYDTNIVIMENTTCFDSSLIFDPGSLEFVTWNDYPPDSTFQLLVPDQILSISNYCGIDRDWNMEIVTGASWIEVDKMSGTSDDQITVSLRDSTYTAGTFTGMLLFKDATTGEPLASVGVSLVVKDGVNVGVAYASPGQMVKVPIIVSHIDSLTGFTIPLKWNTTQDTSAVQLDSVIWDGNMVDTIIILPDSNKVLVSRPSQIPPLPDSSYQIGYMMFSIGTSASNEIVTIDTTTIDLGGTVYSLEYTNSSGQSFVPEFEPGAIYIGYTTCLGLDELEDKDGDLLPAGCENCPQDYNPGQEDNNPSDSYGNACCCGVYTGGYTGNTDCDTDGKRNLADITTLISHVYIGKQPLCCPYSGNVNGDIDGKTNLADITRLIDHVYVNKAETAVCQ